MYLERTVLLFLFSTEGHINPFHATGIFPYPLKTSENLWFYEAFKGVQKEPVVWNESMWTFAL